MAWDRAEPQDTTKIRDLGTVIRPNFQAIDSADSSFKPIALNLSDRDTDPLSGSSDPTALASAYLLYCKQDTGGNAELFGIDENSVISQFTQTARTLAQTGYAVIPPGILLQWGRSTISGGTGTKAVVFPATFGAAAWVVQITSYASIFQAGSSNPGELGVSNATITTTGFTAQIFNRNAVASVPFGWIAIGAVV